MPTGSISELVGPAGAGKTQMCLTLAVAAAAPPRAGGLGGGVVFIDTEQKFSGVRLAEIARAKFPTVYGADAPFEAAQSALRELTGKVLVLTPSTLSEILQRLNGLEEALIDHGVRLLVVDSVAALARAEFGRGQLVQRQELLGQIASVLKQQAERLHMAAGSCILRTRLTRRLKGARSSTVRPLNLKREMNRLQVVAFKVMRPPYRQVFVTNQVTTRIGAAATAVGGGGGNGESGSVENDGGSVTAALGTKWAHCVNTRYDKLLWLYAVPELTPSR